MNAVEQRNAAVREKVTSEIDRLQKETMFPESEVNVEFEAILRNALRCHTLQTAQCDLATFKTMAFGDVTQFSLREMGVALNIIETTSANSLIVSNEEYIRILEIQEEMAKKWHDIWNPILEDIKNKHIPKTPLFIPHGQKKR